MPENDLPTLGKISPEIFDELIYPRLGVSDPSVIVGPRHGVDVAIVEIGDQAMALTTDPVFIVPEYGWERAAWFAIHILASDVVTSALPPRFLTIDLNLPEEMPKSALDSIWRVIHQECVKLGVAIVSGHTARYEGCHYPMVGGATMIAIGSKEQYITPKMANPGDKVIITKGPAIETTGLFAATFPSLIEKEFGPAFRESAERVFWQMSVVEDAQTAASVGVREAGVTTMHDATECGVWGALYEISHASGVGMRIQKDAIVMPEAVEKVCGFFGIDPFKAISEGTLVLTCRPAFAEAIVWALGEKGIKSSIAGEVLPESEGIIIREGNKEWPLEHPRVDPFWAAFGQALKERQAG